ncbi:hypothetical protein WJ968_32920 [Achromobacter xylosoxidans]|uniref:hypothetical protein n=1 Tax=Alcaligenes xylosoxydans xylosoxydans TaxID=85698 RepID=UPI0006C6402A|nr:hypothetical protein [Achromobacter xylosoxidans]CUJ71674.1 Uncharacterised protein [Achromobacter xylosoxidans]
MTTIKNLTPHDITVFNANNEPVLYEKSGHIARVAVTRNKVSEVNGTDVFTTTYGDIEIGEGFVNDIETIYIVSAMVKSHPNCPANFYGLGDQVRDADGKPIGAKGLVA